MVDKAVLRDELLSLRRSMSLDEVSAMSRVIASRLCGLREIQRSTVVMAYMPIRNEVDTRPLLVSLRTQGKNVAVPVVLPGGRLAPVLLPGDSRALTPGPFGILEPPLSAAESVDPEELDLILVPGIAFSTAGYRLGYGKGYFDRFLSTLLRFRAPENELGADSRPAPSCHPCLIGLGYDFQIIDTLPAEPHDIPVDIVVTERRVLRPESSNWTC